MKEADQIGVENHIVSITICVICVIVVWIVFDNIHNKFAEIIVASMALMFSGIASSQHATNNKVFLGNILSLRILAQMKGETEAFDNHVGRIALHQKYINLYHNAYLIIIESLSLFRLYGSMSGHGWTTLFAPVHKVVTPLLGLPD